MAIAQENIERIQRMESYLNDYAKTLEETKKKIASLAYIQDELLRVSR